MTEELIWALGALKILAKNATVPGAALRDTIGEIERLQKRIEELETEVEKLETESERMENEIYDLQIRGYPND
jgi:predicted  nucleic acid-binding Zn-ribbon protein